MVEASRGLSLYGRRIEISPWRWFWYCAPMHAEHKILRKRTKIRLKNQNDQKKCMCVLFWTHMRIYICMICRIWNRKHLKMPKKNSEFHGMKIGDGDKQCKKCIHIEISDRHHIYARAHTNEVRWTKIHTPHKISSFEFKMTRSKDEQIQQNSLKSL